MKCSLTLTLEFRDENIARNVMHAVRLDNGDWISTRQEGNRLLCTAASDTLGGLLHTAEDFLSCVSLAERMQKKEK
ncbi:MAG: KEOPS complex subunit Pcc1 [Thermoplasmata archaeon]